MANASLNFLNKIQPPVRISTSNIYPFYGIYTLKSLFSCLRIIFLDACMSVEPSLHLNEKKSKHRITFSSLCTYMNDDDDKKASETQNVKAGWLAGWQAGKSNKLAKYIRFQRKRNRTRMLSYSSKMRSLYNSRSYYLDKQNLDNF